MYMPLQTSLELTWCRSIGVGGKGWKAYIVRQGRRKKFLQINQPDDIGILGVGPRNQFSPCPSQVRQQGIRTVEAHLQGVVRTFKFDGSRSVTHGLPAYEKQESPFVMKFGTHYSV